MSADPRGIDIAFAGACAGRGMEVKMLVPPARAWLEWRVGPESLESTVKEPAEYHAMDAAAVEPDPLGTDTDQEALAELLRLTVPISGGTVHTLEGEVGVELNVACQRLCSNYSAANPLVRAHVRGAVGRDLSWTLVRFSRRCAVLARCAPNPVPIDYGLTANAIAGLRHGDVRDTLVALEELWQAGTALSTEPEKAFNLAAERACDTMAALFTDYARQALGGVGE